MKNISFSIMIMYVFLITTANAAGFDRDDTSRLKFDFDAFATLGYSKFKSDEGVYYAVGEDEKVSYDNATKAGVQFSIDYLNNYSLTAQFMTKGVNDYDIETSWLNIAYKLNRNFKIRVGRMRTPIYLFSENSDINYSFPMARPAQEVYYQVLMEKLDGVELLSTHMIGDWDVSFQATYGGAEEDVWAKVDYKALVLSMMATNYEYTFRVSAAKAEISSSMLDKLGDLYVDWTQSYGGTYEDAKEFLEVDDNPATFFGLGMMYDYDNKVFMAEYAIRKVKTLYPSTRSFSALAGYRFGKALPYIQYATINATDADDKSYDYPNPYVNMFYNESAKYFSHVDQTSMAIGMRYDLTDKVSITGEYKKISTDDKYYGVFVCDPEVPFNISDSYLTSLLVDIVF